jgi:cytochrome c-type biogenesis protein
MSGGVGIAAAFVAGLISFLSPCVLPLIPAYVSFMTGMSLAELTGGERRTSGVLGPIMLFVAGFTAVFVGLGAGASVLGSVLIANKLLLTRVAGGVIVLLGVVLLDVIPLPFLRGGASIDAASIRRFGPLASLVLGLTFPFALGPCAGPVYGAILTLAADGRSVSAGALLLLVYSAGLAVPFIAVSLLLGRVTGALRWFAGHAKLVQRIAGAVLVLMGLAMLTGLIERAAPLLRAVPFLGSLG